jgi:hypothetical protein
MSWRDYKKIHPIAKRFPAFEPDALQELANDIENSGGLRLPVRTCTDGDGDLCVFEGVNRLDALELAGHQLVDMEGKWTPFAKSCIQYRGHLSDAQIAQEILSLNLMRRDLTKQKKVELIDALLKLARTDSANMARSVKRDEQTGQLRGSAKDDHKAAVTEHAVKVGISRRTVERALAATEPETTPEPDEPETLSEPEQTEPVATLPEIEIHIRELAKDVRDMISKVIHHHRDWGFGRRAWLCSKAGSKLAALARELSRQEKEQE